MVTTPTLITLTLESIRPSIDIPFYWDVLETQNPGYGTYINDTYIAPGLMTMVRSNPDPLTSLSVMTWPTGESHAMFSADPCFLDNDNKRQAYNNSVKILAVIY